MAPKVRLPFWRLLIIEDNPLVQLGMKKVLADCHNLTLIGVADGGLLGIEMTLREKPDLVIVNVGLPGAGGIEVTQKIKVILPETKIIIFTSHTNREEVLAALSGGADAYCIKGRDLDVLTTAIATVAQDSIYLDAKIAEIVIQSLDSLNRKYTGLISEREHEVLRILVEGLSNPQIAKRLCISPNTVKVHIRG